jgi:hypothetical protein
VAEADPAAELTPEELIEHVRRMKVSDLLLSTISTVAQLGYAKLDPSGRDLEQAKLAIESLRALVPVLEGAVADEVLRDFQQVTANLQLAYAKAAEEQPGEDSGVSPDDGADRDREQEPEPE